MDVRTIAVIGAGTMGRGIAYASAYGGYRTVLEDISPEMLERSLAWIRQSFDEGVARGKVDAALAIAPRLSSPRQPKSRTPSATLNSSSKPCRKKWK